MRMRCAGCTQGAEDAVVPSNQVELLVEALRRNGKPVEYLLFSGEQQSFPNAATIQRAWTQNATSTLSKYSRLGMTS
jgi:dipeptidyl aminopeptidase/acylaminoacyl peptidase